MSDAQNFGFGKLVPGFDFLQNLAKGASEAMPQMPGFSNWIAPTLSVEEVDKRISELRAVQFWLEQNNRALAATVQALEVQKMTLVTLAGMNVTMSDLADALKVQPTPDAGKAAAPASSEPAAPPEADGSADAEASSSQGKRKAAGSGSSGSPGASQAAGGGAPGVIDPVQWWTSLTQQFQQIAVNALQEAGQKRPADLANDAMKTASDMTRAAADAMTQGSGGARKRGSGTASTGKAGATAQKADGARRAGAASRSGSAKKTTRSRGSSSSGDS